MSDIELLDKETAITVEARASIALKPSETEQHLRALAVKNVAITQVIDQPGRAQAHGAAMELKRTRVAVEATSKAARDDATKFSKAVIAEEKRLIAIIEPEEVRLLKLRDDWDDAMAEIKAEADRKERARIMAINERIAGVRNYISLAMECRTSERIQGLLDKLASTWIAYDFEADFAEFGDEAQDVYNQTHQRLTALIGQKKDEELERARVKAEQEAAAEYLRKQREELAAAQAEAKRLADEAEAKVRAAAEEMAAQRAAFEAERLAFDNSQREAKEAADKAAYMAAILEPKELLAPVECALADTETIAYIPPTQADFDTGVVDAEVLSMPLEPVPPSVDALIEAVATKFNVTMGTAAYWLMNAADEIATFE